MAIEMILAPIQEDLVKFEGLIDEFLDEVDNPKIRENYKVFFKARGKYLRPSLLMLAAGAAGADKIRFDRQLYKLGLILELLHSASLVHDDIVDEDIERRGEQKVNQVFGNKIAVLAGDTLFSYAFREVTAGYDKPYALAITNLALDMCKAELLQANSVDSFEDYIEVITGKTAEFMAVACSLGARYAGADEAMIQRMYDLGLSVGKTYQMVDDIIDGDPNALRYIDTKDIQASYEEAAAIIEGLAPSPDLTSFNMLLDYILAMND